MSASNPINAKSCKGIMQKRILVTESHVGKRIFLTVQGNGTVIGVTDKNGEPVQSVREPGTQLMKKIINFKANSAIAMANPRNKQLLLDAIAAEKAGDTQKADKAFSDYLNAVQISYGLLLPASVDDQLVNGVEISAKIRKISTENGSLLTLEDSTIAVVAPEVAGLTTFAFPDEEEDETPEVPAADQFAAMDRAALVAFNKSEALGLKTKNMKDEEIREAVRAAYAAKAKLAASVLDEE